MEDSIADNPTETLIKELQELEDAYAECMSDEVDGATLRMLWLRIKALKRELAIRKEKIA